MGDLGIEVLEGVQVVVAGSAEIIRQEIEVTPDPYTDRKLGDHMYNKGARDIAMGQRATAAALFYIDHNLGRRSPGVDGTSV